MKGQFKKLIAGFLLFSLTLSMFSVTAGAAGTSEAVTRSALISGGASEPAVSEDAFIKGTADRTAQLDISSATWKKVGSSWRLKSSSGKYKKGFVKYKGDYYYFDSKGNMKVGWFKVSGKKYFASRCVGAKNKGKILTGLFKIDNKYYYLNPKSKPHAGVMMTGFQKVNGSRRYFQSNGIVKTGWFTVKGSKYYGSKTESTIGKLLTGTRKIGNSTYQFDSNGKLLRTVSISSVNANSPASVKYQHMIDISEWQGGSIDFKKVKASGVKSVIIRCGYGKFDGHFHTDDYFYNNIKKAKAAGLSVGIYYFSYAYTRQQAINEANHCLRLIKGYKINLPVYFDWEYDSMNKARKHMSSKSFKNTNWRTNITDMTAAFCKTIAQNGYRAGFYFNLDYLNRYYNLSKLKNYSKWYAYWGSNKPGSNIWAHANGLPTPTAYDVWQFTSRGRIPGTSGYIDCDLLLKPSIKK